MNISEKTCLVTGGAGFIGSHLVDELVQLGCKVRVLDNLANGNLDNLASIMSRYGFADRWAYRFPLKSEWFGLSDRRRRRIVQSADLLINVSGSLQLTF